MKALLHSDGSVSFYQANVWPENLAMEPFEEFEARIARSRAEKRLARVVLLRALAGREVPFYAPCRGNGAVVVHRDTYQETLGQWRVTRFIEDEPIGHMVSRTFALALHEAQEWQAVLPLARSLSTL